MNSMRTSSLMKTELVKDINEVITYLIKVLSGIYWSNVDDETKFLLITRLETGISLLINDFIEFDKENFEESVDKAIKKIEDLMPFVKENLYDDKIKRLGEHLQVVYDELLSDKVRLGSVSHTIIPPNPLDSDN